MDQKGVCMRFRIILSCLTVLLIVLSGAAVKRLNADFASSVDAVSSATLLHAYGGKDYNVFLNGFQIPATEKQIEVITLYLGNRTYVMLANTANPGGYTITERLNKRPETSAVLSIPYDASDSVYEAHTRELAKELTGLGYTITLRPYNTVHFRSMAHSKHFDIILLEARTLS